MKHHGQKLFIVVKAMQWQMNKKHNTESNPNNNKQANNEQEQVYCKTCASLSSVQSYVLEVKSNSTKEIFEKTKQNCKSDRMTVVS